MNVISYRSMRRSSRFERRARVAGICSAIVLLILAALEVAVALHRDVAVPNLTHFVSTPARVP